MVVTVMAVASAGLPAAQSPPPIAKRDSNYTVPRTPWGDPDLQGKWPGTDMVGTPLQRDPKLGTRNVLTDAEYKQVQERFARQAAQDEADFDLEHATATPGGDVGGPVSPPPHWLERGKPQYQASLIVDPPDGRMPALTPAAQKRQAAARAAREGRGPADSYTDRSLYDRCISRGIAGSILPVIYNNGNEIVQAPGFVAIRNEMIHETRDRAARRAPASEPAHQDVDGRFARVTGTAILSSWRRRTSAASLRASASTAEARVTAARSRSPSDSRR